MTSEKRLPGTDTVSVALTAKQAGEDMEMLTPEEENVVRMRHGLGEDDDYELKFGLGASAETLAKLANLEKFLIEKFGVAERIDGAFDADTVDVEAKRMIIDKFKDV